MQLPKWGEKLLYTAGWVSECCSEFDTSKFNWDILGCIVWAGDGSDLGGWGELMLL